MTGFTCLGIETSCDETSIAIVRNGLEVLAHVVRSQDELHKIYGGVVPEIASRAHVECIIPVFEQVMHKAGIPLSEIDAIAVTNSPGLIGSLFVGIVMAKTIAYVIEKPLIGVDHIHAHIYASKLSYPDLTYPTISLVVSGGHTCLYKSLSETRHLLLGSTLDDAAGEAFDKGAKLLGLGYPGGPAIQKKAEGFDPKKYRFPRALPQKNVFDFSFSGLKTSLLYKVKGQNARQERRLTDEEIGYLAAGYQEAICDVLVKKGINACLKYKINKITVGGGVACNKRLREKFQIQAQKKGIDVYFPPLIYCLDNAAMVAGLAYHLYKEAKVSDLYLDAIPTRRG